MKRAEVQKVERAELENSQLVSATFINKFYISITPGGVRIAFAETHPELPVPSTRTAVIMPYPDAFALRDVLSQMLEKYVQIEDVSQSNLDKEEPAKNG